MSTPAGFTALVAANIQDPSGALLAAGTLTVIPTDENDIPLDSVAGGAGGALSTAGATFPITNGVIGPAGLLSGQAWMGAWVAQAYAALSVVKYTDGNYYVATAAATSGQLPGAGAPWAPCTNAVGPWIADTALTKPANLFYRFVVKNALGRPVYTKPGYQFAAAPTSTASFNFDTTPPPATPSIPYVQGPSGLSAYELWLADGNSGSEASFLASLIGQGYHYRGAWAPDTAWAAYDQYTQGGNTYNVNTPYTSGSSFGSTDTANATIYAAAGSGLSSAQLAVVLTGGATATTPTVLGAVTSSGAAPSASSDLCIYGTPFAVTGPLTELQISLISSTGGAVDVVILNLSGSTFTVADSFTVTPATIGGWATQTFAVGTAFSARNVTIGQYIGIATTSGGLAYATSGGPGFSYLPSYSGSIAIGDSFTAGDLAGWRLDIAATVSVTGPAPADSAGYATADALAALAGEVVTSSSMGRLLSGSDVTYPNVIGALTNYATAPASAGAFNVLGNPFAVSGPLVEVQCASGGDGATPGQTITFLILNQSGLNFTVADSFSVTLTDGVEGYTQLTFKVGTDFAARNVTADQCLGIYASWAGVAYASSGGIGFWYSSGYTGPFTTGSVISTGFLSSYRVEMTATVLTEPPAAIDAAGYVGNSALAPVSAAVANLAQPLAGSVLYFMGSSITRGYGLSGAVLNGGGVTGCYANLIATSAWAAGSTCYNSGVDAIGSAANLTLYNNSQNYAGPTVPSAHSVSPAQTGNTKRCYFIVDMSFCYNDRGAGVATATTISNFASLTEAAMADGWYVVILTGPIVTTGDAAGIVDLQTCWQAVRNGVVPSNQVIEMAEFLPNQYSTVFYQTTPIARVHPNALGHACLAAGVLPALMNGSQVNYGGGYHIIPQSMAGGLNLMDSSGNWWNIQPNTGGTALIFTSTTPLA